MPTMEHYISQTRLQIQKNGNSPNNTTGNDAWEVLNNAGIIEDGDSEALNQQEFIREWYGAVTRAQKLEVERRQSEGQRKRSSGGRQRGIDQHGNPTNMARVEALEADTAQMWLDLTQWAAGKSKKIRKMVADAQTRAKEAAIAAAQAVRDEAEARAAARAEKNGSVEA